MVAGPEHRRRHLLPLRHRCRPTRPRDLPGSDPGAATVPDPRGDVILWEAGQEGSANREWESIAAEADPGAQSEEAHRVSVEQ